MKQKAKEIEQPGLRRYRGISLRNAIDLKVELLFEGQRFIYRVVNGSIEPHKEEAGRVYAIYLGLFETVNRLLAEFGTGSLITPMIFLPVNRTNDGNAFSVTLSQFSEFDLKQIVDASTSRNSGSVLNFAIGRIATKYRLLLEDNNVSVTRKFYSDPQINALTKTLRKLGYEWKLEVIDPLKNQYDIRLTKQGSSFLVSVASSGEKELLTYLFAIYALNVRDALILIDEPELHLHPKWQRALFDLFEELSTKTGNQFILATHSPVFISPGSIQYVSRIYSDHQRSRIVRLNDKGFPDARHLFNIVNSQNNERMFFADRVILVEGISDRLFWQAYLKATRNIEKLSTSYEVVDVGGKGYFGHYQAILNASKVPYSIIADLDYVEQIGTSSIKKLFVLDAKEIIKDVFKNAQSLDGQALMDRIDEALQSGNFEDAREIWNYLKSHRRKLKPEMSDKDTKFLRLFISLNANKGIFILSRGALEAYLPEGYRAKDIDKLIHFLEKPDFVKELPQYALTELGAIADRLTAQK
jgi:hypothetical protein